MNKNELFRKSHFQLKELLNNLKRGKIPCTLLNDVALLIDEDLIKLRFDKKTPEENKAMESKAKKTIIKELSDLGSDCNNGTIISDDALSADAKTLVNAFVNSLIVFLEDNLYNNNESNKNFDSLVQ